MAHCWDMRKRGREAWAKWRGLVSEQGGSGQSVAAFCRERGICAPQFFAWKRLSQAASEPFVEVRVVGAQEPAHSRAIEIRPGGGHVWQKLVSTRAWPGPFQHPRETAGRPPQRSVGAFSGFTWYELNLLALT